MAEIAYITAGFAGDVVRRLVRLPLLVIVMAGVVLVAALAVALPVLIVVAAVARIARVTGRIIRIEPVGRPSWTR